MDFDGIWHLSRFVGLISLILIISSPIYKAENSALVTLFKMKTNGGLRWDTYGPISYTHDGGVFVFFETDDRPFYVNDTHILSYTPGNVW